MEAYKSFSLGRLVASVDFKAGEDFYPRATFRVEEGVLELAKHLFSWAFTFGISKLFWLQVEFGWERKALLTPPPLVLTLPQRVEQPHLDEDINYGMWSSYGNYWCVVNGNLRHTQQALEDHINDPKHNTIYKDAHYYEIRRHQPACSNRTHHQCCYGIVVYPEQKQSSQ